MKKLCTMLLAMVVLVLAGCEKNNEEDRTNITVPNQTQLTQTVYADQTTGASGVTFTTAGAWRSSIDEGTAVRSSESSASGWISIDPDSGDKAGSYTVNIRLTTNDTGEKRSATITIICGGDKIMITITQESVTQEGIIPEPEQPEPSTGTVKKINGQQIEYHDDFMFNRIGEKYYGNKYYSQTEWAYVSDATQGATAGWSCYFTYGNNGLVSFTEYSSSRTSPYTYETSYKWSGNRLETIYGTENSNSQNIEYGEIEYTKGNIDMNWFVAHVNDRANHSFRTPWESAIGIKSIPHNKLISKIVVKDNGGTDKYSGTCTFEYTFNQQGYITKIVERFKWLLGGMEDSINTYEFEY